jgi:hypothetical protein
MARNKQGKAPSKIKYAPPKRFSLNFNDPSVVKLIEGLPKGLFAVLANENARYTAFHASTSGLALPYGSRISFHTGCYVVDSSNKAVMGINPDEDWVQIMGDDHKFPPHMSIKLLALMYKHDLDIIVPLCFKRSFPPAPVVYNLGEDGLPYHLNLVDYPDGGLVEVYCAGTAGMIIRQRVLRKMQAENDLPFFQLGGEHWGEDLDFCRRARTHGFKVHCDLDMPLGHILNTCIWPQRDDNGAEGTGEWGCFYEHNEQGGYFLKL